MPPKPKRPPDFTRLSETDKNDLIVTLFARMEALEAKLGMNSGNSSKPPSFVGLTKKTSSLRNRSGKPPGGQVDRKGGTFKRALQPTGHINHPLPSHRERCHHELPVTGAGRARCGLRHSTAL